MNEKHVSVIAEELNIREKQVEDTGSLLAEGATVPFISRYRKEVTGGLDEVQIIQIRDRLEQLHELDKRREAILKSLDDQGKLSDELKAKVLAAETMSTLEDIYLPYRPKRRTRGTIAKEKGLEPLALTLFEQKAETDIESEAEAFVDEEKGVKDVAEALAGARDIIAEWINEDEGARKALRMLFTNKATYQAKVIKGKEEEGVKFKDYYEWEEPAAKAPSHRILAVRRGASEGFLTFRVLPDEEDAHGILERMFVKKDGGPSAEQVLMAIKDGYKRLLGPSMETEIRLESKKRADEEAITVFVKNLRELLLSSPMGQKAVLAIDPGLRTGCKVVCLDPQGKLLHNDTIYPLEPKKQTEKSAATLKALAERFDLEAVAIGNGTGGRETLALCKAIDFGRPMTVVMVNESGASVYSASETARSEFPDHDVTVRGAVSIGRRLMDPLAELVKIDPKAIGVGQYQHDVDQKALRKSLDDTVESCVNAVGVEVNTASKELLRYVSGLSERLAGSIVEHRNENGPFISRDQFKKVAGMGPKTFEQAAGFLRIMGAENPLDASAVHPESYPVVEAMANDLDCSVSALMGGSDLRADIKLESYITDKIGIPTLTDIMDELAKPGRDPREPFEIFTFTEGVNDMADLREGMKLPGVVTNVTDFGAFVDVGVHQDGLVHISELADTFVKNPHDVVKVHQRVKVTVIGVDMARKRIALSMKEDPFRPRAQKSGDKPAAAKGGPRPGAKKPNKKKEATRRPDNPFAKALKDWKGGKR